jgi:phenylacetyl-CoA:acceptor oxidoreductase subunit 2
VKAPATFGPKPWQQTFWDWRAAGNFVCGGAGAGLVAFAVLSGIESTRYAAALLGGLALIGLGLLCVWLEIGRPWRALHVFFNPRTSWMTRESLVAAALLPLGLASLVAPGVKGLVLLLALAFVYCQSRILQAAKGIPAWREPLLVPLVFTSGLAEGGGLWLLTGPLPAGRGLLLLFGALVVGRAWIWFTYRRRLQSTAAPAALAALDASGRALQVAGTWPALVAVLLVAGGVLGGAFGAGLLALAGALAAFAGAHFKATLITRAGFNQGFALTHLPVRGARR